MASETGADNNRVEFEARIARIQRQMRYLWLPGRRFQLVNECYEIGYDLRQNGSIDLAEKIFRTGIDLVEGRRPWRTKRSLAIFSVVAACHNHLGLQYLDERRFEDAAKSFDSAIGIRHELRRLFPKERENEVYLGGALCNRGHASAGSNPTLAKVFYEQSLSILRQPIQTCDCSYWDEERQTWWCEQLEGLGQLINLPWVELAPLFIDNATAGIQSLVVMPAQDDGLEQSGSINSLKTSDPDSAD